MQPNAALALAAALSGCGIAQVPRLGVLPAFEARFEDRVWRDDGPDAARGAIWVFMSDGTLLTADCEGTYRLAPWRRVDATRLVWEEGSALVQAEVAGIGPRAFALVVDPDGAAASLAFSRVDAPLGCLTRPAEP